MIVDVGEGGGGCSVRKGEDFLQGGDVGGRSAHEGSVGGGWGEAWGGRSAQEGDVEGERGMMGQDVSGPPGTFGGTI